MTPGAALAAVDHLLLGVPDLDAGIAWVAERAGVRPAPGGSHPGKGTRNALAGLGPRCYLEVLAPDPAQPGAGSSLLDLTRVAAPTLARWAAVGRDLDALAARLSASAPPGVEVEGPLPGGRRRADGVALAWRTVAVRGPAVRELGGVVPFYIAWDPETTHPAADAPPLGTLTALRLFHPRPAAAQAILDWMELPVDVAPADRPALAATIVTARGTLELG